MTDEDGWSKSPDRGQRSTDRSKGARSNPKSEETLRLTRQKGEKNPHPTSRVTAQRATIREVNPGEGRGESRRWSQIAAERKVRDEGGYTRK